MGIENTNSVGTRRFDKSLNEDINDYHLPENSWTHARNAINNSKTGDLGKLGNEPSNLECLSSKLPSLYTIIGFIALRAGYWVVFSTDDVNSAMGIFYEDTCSYYPFVDETKCLKFKKDFLIKGVSRATSNCNFKIYWDDSNNVSRIMTVTIEPPTGNVYTDPNSPVSWKQKCVLTGDCNICTNLPDLDCDALRLARFITIPCIETLNGVGAGTLLNGSYMVAVAYSIKGQKISDWFLSNVQPIFRHNNASGSIDVALSNLDQDFDEIIVVIVSVTNQQTVARRAGIYSTRQKYLSFDTIDNTWIAVPIEELPLMTPIMDKTDAMYNVSDFLIRVGPTSKEDFNYQPLANQIVTKWQAVEYPTHYYRKGGNKTNYLRDEVYPFFIEWAFDTGDFSASYHIPGRPGGTIVTINDFTVITGADTAPETTAGLIPYNWVVNNTSIQTLTPGTILPDGGVVVGEGLMGYWESTEIYPDNKPQIWNANLPVSPYAILGLVPTNVFGTAFPNSGTAHDLCGKQIRHHKFPDIGLSFQTQYLDSTGSKIRIMAVKFENIKHPVMNDGVTPVPGIIGYRILRGARNGNKTILAKGLINNMRKYDVPNGQAINTIHLFPNYPYNELGGSPANNNPYETGNADPFLSNTKTSYSVCNPFGGNGSAENGYSPQRIYSRIDFTFHSPDTNFTDPFLSAKELKVHGEFNGDVVGKFDKSEQHPREKLLGNSAFFIAAVGGIAIAALAMQGKRTVKHTQPYNRGLSEANIGGETLDTRPYGVGLTPFYLAIDSVKTSPTFLDDTFLFGLAEFDKSAGNVAFDPIRELTGGIVGLLTGTPYDQTLTWGVKEGFLNGIKNITHGYSSNRVDTDQEDGALKNTPSPLRLFSSLPTYFHYFTQGTDTTLDLIKAVVRYRDFALRYHSHGYYNRYRNPQLNNTRRVINDQQYIGPQISNLSIDKRVNNLYRAKTVAIALEFDAINQPLADPQVNDVTRILASHVDNLFDIDNFGNGELVDPTKESFGPYMNGLNTSYNSNIQPGTFPVSGNAGSFYPGHSGIQIASSHYASLKQRIRNQYGQINGVLQVPASICIQPAPISDIPNATINSDTVFGGDTYLGRYTEKNTFFYFYNWLYGQPDGAQFDYTKNEMIPYPRFWGNFDQFETSDFTASVGAFLGTVTSGSPDPSAFILPSSYYNLDGLHCPSGSMISILGGALRNIRLSVKDAWFYLFNSGVKDFYVESEINIDFRDYGEIEEEVHYDPYRYTDTRSLFDTKIIKTGNFYKYDQSLSIAKLFINYTSWASSQQIAYDPFLAETCFIYSPRRVIYSLPAQFEGNKDNWYIFLPNNYKDFLSRVTCIKPINKSGAIIFFDAESPVQFQGTDQLETGLGTKLTIGDGGLFSQPLQSITNADRPYEYASCQNRLSVINTPAGVFWISQNQGKIFNYVDGLDEISMQDLKWWFATYLPYRLTEDFLNFQLKDNPVIGIGCQAIYDNQNGLIYFTKRDFVLRKDLPKGLSLAYTGSNNFDVMYDNGNGIPVRQFSTELGDPVYFHDASWTVSFDPKTKGWIGYHDWHPNLMLPGKNTFLTTLDDSIWIHNERCDSYCNYYGKDYPFEVEYSVNTVHEINTLRSVEYILEVYKYAANCFDRFHVLDFNFDEAVVYNTEQVSGLLGLSIEPKNDPQRILAYPQVNFNSIDILFSKEENKYRFNQFFDITSDRGEFNSMAQRMIWDTQANGYIRDLNSNNMDYNKDPFQRKKFRHYSNVIFLRRKVSGDKKMLVMIVNNKNLNSPR